MDLIKRKELAKFLRWGDKTKIADLANVSRQTVQLWFKGEVKDSVVESYVLLFVEKRKQEVENRMSALTL
jgi:hypothetical protein